MLTAEKHTALESKKSKKPPILLSIGGKSRS
jgi:hypothetical protein